MKKRLLSLLVCLCMLASALGVTALAAESESQPDLVVTEGPALYLDGEKLVPTAEGATHTFENGGVATLTNLGTNEAGGTDYALTLENVRATKSVRMAWGENFFAAVFFFIGGTDEISFFEAKDTLAVTLKGTNFIAIQGQPDEIIATALVSSCPLSLSGEGSLFLMAAPAEGAETACIGINVTGDLTVGASLNVSGAGAAMALNGELTLTDGATLRWPTELTQADRTDAPIGLGGRTLMNGEAVADSVVVAAPSDPVTRGVAVFNLWKLAGSPKPEGEYPFSDEPMAMAGFLRDAIHWAGATGLANGYGDGKFGDNDPITNEQFAALLCRMLTGHSLEQELPEDYAYADSVGSWAKGDVAACAANGWAPDPKGVLTHSEMDRLVAVLGRMLERKAG